MKKILLITLGLGVAAGIGACRQPKVSQQTGTEFMRDGDGHHSRPVTYVSPEEYDRMTEAERKRLNATIGVQATWTTTRQSTTQPLRASELDKALKPK